MAACLGADGSTEDKRAFVGAASGDSPPDPAGLFSEGGEVITLHIEGSLTIPVTGIKRV